MIWVNLSFSLSLSLLFFSQFIILNMFLYIYLGVHEGIERDQSNMTVNPAFAMSMHLHPSHTKLTIGCGDASIRVFRQIHSKKKRNRGQTRYPETRLTGHTHAVIHRYPCIHPRNRDVYGLF